MGLFRIPGNAASMGKLKHQLNQVGRSISLIPVYSLVGVLRHSVLGGSLDLEAVGVRPNDAAGLLKVHVQS